ncbi:unnamed protein product [Angiostrongylus costaricensis]|uniref:Kringle domain-containing protein n=1 Tax=Angiostrongylus costaricensis TaxID=334426 RepID=A0A158PHP0_ANGCS|nr:unnamed protein product [Angiostrongylus costaricensis]
MHEYLFVNTDGVCQIGAAEAESIIWIYLRLLSGKNEVAFAAPQTPYPSLGKAPSCLTFHSQHTCNEVLPGADCVLQEDMASYIYLGDRNHDAAGESCLVWRDVYDKIVKDLEKKPNELEQYQFNMTKAEEVMLHNKCRRAELSAKHPLMATSHVQGPWCYVRKKGKIMAVNCFDACKGEPREEDVHPGKTYYGEQLVEKNYNDILIENIRRYYTHYSWGSPSYYYWKPSDDALSDEFFRRREKMFYGCAATVIVLILWLLLCLYIRNEAAATRRRREQAIKWCEEREYASGSANTSMTTTISRRQYEYFSHRMESGQVKYGNTDELFPAGLAVNKALTEIANAIPIPAPVGPQKRYSNIPYCTTPQTVRDCYATYLEKYGIHSGPYYLPEYSRLEQQLKTMPLTNICREFDELLSCLRLVSFDCISIPVFERFTQWYGKVNEESVAYVQNHAFLEFACGVGKPAFLANHDCLSRAFNVQSLTQRINNCLPSDSDMCTRALRAVDCIKDSLSLQCSPSAGSAACFAATNIALRAKEEGKRTAMWACVEFESSNVGIHYGTILIIE